jgi:hypothetical protein
MSFEKGFRPSIAQVFRWAADLAIPTAEERAWLNDPANESWVKYIDILRDAIAEGSAKPVPAEIRSRTVLQRSYRLLVEDARLIGKAKARFQGQGEARLIDAEHNEALVFRVARSDVLGLRICERLPTGPAELRVGGAAVELLTGFDKYGYATVKERALERVLAGSDALDLCVMVEAE